MTEAERVERLVTLVDRELEDAQVIGERGATGRTIKVVLLVEQFGLTWLEVGKSLQLHKRTVHNTFRRHRRWSELKDAKSRRYMRIFNLASEKAKALTHE